MAGIGSNVGYFVMFFGLILGSMGMFLVGVVMFSAVVLFQLVTLPVEFDATARAKRLAVDQGLILQTERVGMDRVLNAAALTYVAAAVSSAIDAAVLPDAGGAWGAGTRVRQGCRLGPRTPAPPNSEPPLALQENHRFGAGPAV